MTVKFVEWIFYFFKTLQVDIENSVPFRIVPSHPNILGLALLPLPETVFKFFLCNRLQCLRRNLFNLFYAFPVDIFEYIFGAMSSEYGECNICVVPFFTNQSATMYDICGGTLLWCSTQLLGANSSGPMRAIGAPLSIHINDGEAVTKIHHCQP